MSFEETIKNISGEVNIDKKDRPIYTKEYEQIRDHVMEILKKNNVFSRVFGGYNLFGSYLDKIKVGKPDEFDVHFELKLPHQELIEVQADTKPGFVRLNLGEALKRMYNEPNEAEIYNVFRRFVDDKLFLERKPLRNWIDNLFESGLKPGQVCGQYTLSYSKGGTAFTIIAKSNSREIKIDLVPAFQFNRWMAKKPCPTHLKPIWFAVPKPRNASAFSICVPQIEEALIADKKNLKSSLRLIKSLKVRHDKMPRLKSYFIKTVYLWECEKVQASFWNRSVGEIFIHMLGKMCEYFEIGKIPFYWDDRVNLLEILPSDEVKSYKQVLKEVHMQMIAYSKQAVSYETLRKTFSS